MEKFWWIVVPLPTVTVQLIWCKPPLFKPYAIIFSYSFNKGNITKRKERQQEKEKREREEDTDDTYGWYIQTKMEIKRKTGRESEREGDRERDRQRAETDEQSVSEIERAGVNPVQWSPVGGGTSRPGDPLELWPSTLLSSIPPSDLLLRHPSSPAMEEEKRIEPWIRRKREEKENLRQPGWGGEERLTQGPGREVSCTSKASHGGLGVQGPS